MQDQHFGIAVRIDGPGASFVKWKEPGVQEQCMRDGQGRETFIRRRGEDMEESSSAKGVADELNGREVNFVIESCPVNGDVIHARELVTITIDHKPSKSIPGGVDLGPPEIQLLHPECEPLLSPVPGRESLLKMSGGTGDLSTHEEVASGM